MEQAATTRVKTAELIRTGESPLPLGVIPDRMGINLCSVESIEWTRRSDGQLVSLTIHFTPAEDENEERQRLSWERREEKGWR